MTDNVKTIRILAKTAMVLQSISILIFFIVHLIPAPFLKLMAGSVDFPDHPEVYQHPLLFVNPLLRLIAVFLFGYILLQESKKPSAAAPVLMILILVSTVVLGLLSTVISTLTSVLISRMYSAADMGAVSILNTVSGWTGLITAPVIPMLAAAAGINAARQKNPVS